MSRIWVSESGSLLPQPHGQGWFMASMMTAGCDTEGGPPGNTAGRALTRAPDGSVRGVRRLLVVLVVLVAACSSGSKQAATTTTSSTLPATTTSSTTSTTQPTTTTIDGVTSDVVLEHAGVTVAISRFHLVAKSDSSCALELRVSSSQSERCFVVDFTLSAAADIASDEGSAVFDSYVTPDGHEADSVFAFTVRPGASKSYSATFASDSTGGKLFGSLGIQNTDEKKFTVDTPPF